MTRAIAAPFKIFVTKKKRFLDRMIRIKMMIRQIKVRRRIIRSSKYRLIRLSPLVIRPKEKKQSIAKDAKRPALSRSFMRSFDRTKRMMEANMASPIVAPNSGVMGTVRAFRA
jgi:hypothetical protein